jgi:hypothetical protein
VKDRVRHGHGGCSRAECLSVLTPGREAPLLRDILLRAQARCDCEHPDVAGVRRRHELSTRLKLSSTAKRSTSLRGARARSSAVQGACTGSRGTARGTAVDPLSLSRAPADVLEEGIQRMTDRLRCRVMSRPSREFARAVCSYESEPGTLITARPSLCERASSARMSGEVT